MRIWVDGDACPNVIKEILFRAANRTRIPLVLVANQTLNIPNSRYISQRQVPPGFDMADKEIVQRMHSGDLVITADIPLAAEVIEQGGEVISPRGERFTRDNIRQRLSMRNFLEELRGSGVDTGGPAAFSQTDRQAFANQLDRLIRKLSGNV